MMRIQPWPLAILTLSSLAMAQPRLDRVEGGAVEIQPGDDGRAVDDDREGRGEGRVCRNDRLIIDFVGDDARAANVEALGQRVAAALTDARSTCPSWFARQRGDCRVQARPVVDRRTAARANLDALSPRHLELRFTDPRGQALILSNDAVCDAVASVRHLLERSYGERARRDFYVSRACDASVLGDWSQDAVRAAAPPLRGAARRGGIVAIVDGPHTVEGDVVVKPRAGLGDGAVPASSLSYSHADAMGLLIRGAAPEAEIRYYTALDTGGMGSPIGQVANGIARAAADVGGRGPLVINLSLGWPRDMQREMAIRGPSPQVLSEFTRQRRAVCNDAESPSGEVVRAWIAALADRGITIVAAAGNRRAAPDPGALPGTPTRPAAMFYPAAWTPKFRHLLAVGAYGRRPVPEMGVGANAGNRPDLYAPGIRVPTHRPASLSAIVPVLLTGTSGATALTSAALANSPNPDRVPWFVARLTPCPVNALPGTRAKFLGPCPDGGLVEGRRKELRRAGRPVFQPRRRPPVRRRPFGGALSPKPGNGARIALDRYGAGSVGPQPEDNGCMVPCRFFLDIPSADGDLLAKIDLGEPATVKDPRLVFRRGPEKETLFLPASGVPTSPVDILKLDEQDVKVPSPIKLDKFLEVSLEFELEPTATGSKTVRREVELQVLVQKP